MKESRSIENKIKIIAEINKDNKVKCELTLEENLESWEFAFLVMKLLKMISKAWEDMHVDKK